MPSRRSLRWSTGPRETNGPPLGKVRIGKVRIGKGRYRRPTMGRTRPAHERPADGGDLHPGAAADPPRQADPGAAADRSVRVTGAAGVDLPEHPGVRRNWRS